MKKDIHKLIFKPLDKVSDDMTGGFSCGNATIDSYIKTSYFARLDHQNRLASTTVALLGDEVVAFFTSTCAIIEVGEEEASILGLPSSRKHVPAIEIKFLAVDQRYQDQGIGKQVLQYIVADVQELSERHACRFLFLWSVPTEKALKFYEERFFEDTGISNHEGLHLMMFQVAEDIEFEEY